MTSNIEIAGLDDLKLPVLDTEQARNTIARYAEKLHVDGHLKVHCTAHQQAGARQKFSIHLFFDHDGHKHNVDKQHGWDLNEVIRDSFRALETQLEKDRH